MLTISAKYTPLPNLPRDSQLKNKHNKHVSGARSLGWCNTETLRENADPVGQTRAVPEQRSVANLGLERLGLVDREHVQNIERVVAVGGAMCVLQISTG